MLTYNRGQWIEDHERSSEWEVVGELGKLSYEGFDKSLPDISIGENSCLAMTVYVADDSESKYQFFVIVETPLRGIGFFLVTDFPSLLMLAKELNPLWNMVKDGERFEMQEEEHAWKAIEERRFPHKTSSIRERDKQCSHIG
jgi:hypothetical protein